MGLLPGTSGIEGLINGGLMWGEGGRGGGGHRWGILRR